MDQYIRVYGKIESCEEQKYILAYKLVRIKELNEITNHMLEVMDASISKTPNSETLILN